ncbi:nucleus protein [Coprinopsis cinerea okayama7|uniref:Nucleus protein n=1 Tax=Coprinopsis cinerea (strain Okayama-7 / 130 / ATCC MYA-4618 / FGSC 9003) TaxID=240176 RepID=A8N920_COPC7|nr:nucleus protein [Coprinopsis cinerea okayama7\|eukprot:XP_001831348.2 nucleus protein [Coprinopsis cinerea okayama7\
MPRGIPNARKEENGLRYTTFQVPLVPNPKHVSSTYLKSESQTVWYRNSQAKGKGPAAEDTHGDGRRGSQVIVIHPGSRFIRIGRASDVSPVSIPAAVGRKYKNSAPQPERKNCIIRPGSSKDKFPAIPLPQNGDEYDVTPASNDSFDTKLAIITVSLRDRMRFYKLRVTPNAVTIASTFNEQFKPEIITSDPNSIEWIDESCQDEVALRIGNPEAFNYSIRWPFHASTFNLRDYDSLQMLLNDVEALIDHGMQEKLNIPRSEYKNYSVVLVIPDFYDKAYVRDLVTVLIKVMGFKQICAQQVSLAATYGAGISNACVVDIGSKITTIACVDEGLVLPDTRLSLNMGGDDVTEFLHVLLQRIQFPYRTLDLNRSYDWAVLEDLKGRLCTLMESDVALNLYDFIVRRPGAPTEKYGLRAYDEIILAPMCLFEPRVIDFDGKCQGIKPLSVNVTEDIISHPTDNVTKAMVISTQHLMPLAEADPTPPPPPPPASTSAPANANAKQESSDPQAMSVDQPEAVSSKPPAGNGTTEAPIEIIDVDDDTKPPVPDVPPPAKVQVTEAPMKEIDILFEASKLPLDVAIFNSARAAGGDDKIRKYLQAVLVIGGTALIPGMAHALESRLQAIATPLVPNMEKVQIIPPPKEVDPRVLAWKGATVLAKMESVSELWVTPSDWDLFGMRALKERCFYL